MAWTQTSDTCISVYGAVIQLQQIDEHTAFEDAGPIQMKDMQFYNTAASDDVNNASAIALARELDTMLVNSFGATYLGGVDANKARNTLTPILQSSTKTIEDLSDTAATIYTF